MSMPLPLRKAGLADVDAIAALVNEAFRIERFFVEGDRTNPDNVRALMDKGEFLLLEEGGRLIGCVYVELRGASGYFGLLSVDPTRQGQGLATRLIASVEDRCRAAGCREMELLIVNLREELPGFYERLGYCAVDNLPFTPGMAVKLPCHFVKMTKPL
jgi:N-acetylglutamate synthase-like GNAT family acetyltransferase